MCYRNKKKFGFCYFIKLWWWWLFSGYGKIEESFRAPTKDDIVKPYIPEHDFRSFNDDNIIGYSLYVFDIRYQKKLDSAPPMKLDFYFSKSVPAGIYGYGLVLKSKSVSISSDGQSFFDLI